jgi:deoxyribonuclease V
VVHIPRAPHRWSVTPAHAIAIQKRFASLVRQRPPRGPVRLVAGVDAAFSSDEQYCVAAVVLWDLRGRAVVEQRIAVRRLIFPYVPGLLSFREAPVVLAALRKLHTPPDVVLYDGNGFAHPRRFGSACHIGVITHLPTIGCAKNRLIGIHAEPGHRRASSTLLVHDGQVIGHVLRTQDGVRPVYVSIGHRMDLVTAERIVLQCAPQYRLPEPLRLADQLARRECREAESPSPGGAETKACAAPGPGWRAACRCRCR